MKNAKIRDSKPPLEYDSNTIFAIILIKKKMSEKLGFYEVEKVITFMQLDQFLDCFNCREEDAIKWLFEINNHVSKGKKKKSHRYYEQVKNRKNGLPEII